MASLEACAMNLMGVLTMLAMLSISSATPLDEYVMKPDSNFRWYDTGERISGFFLAQKWEAVVINMTSQRWLSTEHVDCSLWNHYLVIVTPQRIARENTALLVIGGGSNLDAIPNAENEELLLTAVIAARTKSLAMVLYQVPNQPCRFRNDPTQGSRLEDHMIAYTWLNFLQHTKDVEWPAYLPMTKSVVRAMDVVQQYATKNLKMQVEGFVIAGSSKRGWVTWTTAAVDKRVIAIVPIVLDCLSVLRNFHHFFQSLGGWSFTLMPYFELNITSLLDSIEFKQLLAIIDPYEYKTRLRMPKLMITASNDENFLIDDSAYFWKNMEGEKHMLILPNTEHSLITGLPKILQAVSSFYLSISMDYEKKSTILHHIPSSLHSERTTQGDKLQNITYVTMRPRYYVQIDRNAGIIDIRAADRPLKATLWYAYTHKSSKRRDFRWLTGALDNCTTFTLKGGCFQPIFFHQKNLQPISIVTKSTRYVATIPVPQAGYGAFFVELRFLGPTFLMPFVFSTEAVIVPNSFPFEDCHGVQCKGTLV